MARYTVSPTARSDLLDIWSFVAEQSPDAADRLVDSFQERFTLLSQSPLLGESRSDLAEDLRQFSVGSYVVFYIPIDAGIRIVRVLHGNRDIPAIFHHESK